MSRVEELEAAIRDALDRIEMIAEQWGIATPEDIRIAARNLESALIDDDTVIMLAQPDDGQPTEAQEWHDYDPDC